MFFDVLYLCLQDDRVGKDTNTNQYVTSLSGKYELLQPLGEGEHSKVFLARHLYLDAECAIKISPKNPASVNQILEEGKLLKSLNHPGIPVIYDFFEDEQFCYLVEEFVDGDPITDYFFHQPIVSKELFLSYVLQLCDIFCYLHRNFPRFSYQDLKPEHVLITNDTLKLIDFCVNCNTSDNNPSIYGNLSFSAPEVILGNPPDERSDIYTLGKFTAHLASSLSEDISSELSPIINTATNEDPLLRFETVEELRTAFEQINQQKTRSSCNQIAVIGNSGGCGATHFAIAMTCVLNHLGYRTLFCDKPGSSMLADWYNSGFPIHKRNGFYYYKDFTGVPRYGSGISIEYPPCTYVVSEFTDFHDTILKNTNRIIQITDGAPWHISKCIEVNELLLPYKERVQIVCLSDKRKDIRRLSKALAEPIYHFWDQSESYCVNKEKISFFRELLDL